MIELSKRSQLRENVITTFQSLNEVQVYPFLEKKTKGNTEGNITTPSRDVQCTSIINLPTWYSLL